MQYLHQNISRKAIAVCAAIALLAASCKKFSDIPSSPDTISPAQVFADSADATAAITGIYIGMIGQSSSSLSIGNEASGTFAGMVADEYDAVSYITAYKEFAANSITVTNVYNQNYLWTPAYKFIYQANAVIEGVNASTGINDALKNRLIGEAKFLRAWFHFTMMNLYGGVPLCLVTDYRVTALLPRADTAAINQQVVADLEDAYQRLQTDPLPLTKYRVNKYAVKAFLARVYLYRKQWAQAEAAATEVIGGNYGLVTNLDSTFLINSREAIWQVPSTIKGDETAQGNAYVPLSALSAPTFFVTTWMNNAFETGDKRKSQWLKSNTVGGVTYTYPYKFKLVRNSAVTVANPHEAHTPLRLAELYLVRAEARAHEGNYTDAEKDVNSIRSRAGLGNVSISSLETAATVIMQERRVELFGEWGHRYFDLKRTGTIDAVLGAEKTGWKSSYALFPIPYNELQGNPNLTPNP
ncbi:SusD family protein [Filimonas lacunae]|uniref:SusD family protein n=1 Tax=Filimonas lacunae TaxID=477680 RepID=A0A173MCT5_9BACT|nr:RagB/SusD family nutrient uptake outer membrane protein [Filimonas lacunae]BAV05394.1 RagB/SusD domain protein [Filimonas lacunae]SIT21473.1 SusD family protein [Filimonas lacunae]